jgi:hypothetical protein
MCFQAKGWGLELSGGLSTSESGFSFFTVDIELTPEGLNHTDEILSIVYQYIRMLKAEPPSVRAVGLPLRWCLSFADGKRLSCRRRRCTMNSLRLQARRFDSTRKLEHFTHARRLQVTCTTTHQSTR